MRRWPRTAVSGSAGAPDETRDKAKVEAGVLLVERWILAALRKRKFFSLGEVNQAIQELLVRLNDRPFRKREGSRRSLFDRSTSRRCALCPRNVTNRRLGTHRATSTIT